MSKVERSKRWRERNKIHVREYHKRWVENNRECHNANMRAFRARKRTKLKGGGDGSNFKT